MVEGMKLTVTSLPDEVWRSLCEMGEIREPAVAAGRARIASNDWPAPIEVADALLRGRPCPSTRFS